jgi:hypothetical protein
MNGLLVDFGGVLTTNVFASAVQALEKGELPEDDLGERFGELLGLAPTRRAGRTGPSGAERTLPQLE